MRTIDVKGLACPAPVIKTKTILATEHPEALTVITDNKASSENVRIFLESQHYQAAIQQHGNEFHVTGTLTGVSVSDQPKAPAAPDIRKKIMVLVSSNRMGHGDDELGAKLMVNYINTLKELGHDLWRLVFINNGVKLTVEGSEVLPALKDLEHFGIRILVCGTCLNHFNLLENKQVGETTNMLDIVTAMQLSDSVISV